MSDHEQDLLEDDYEGDDHNGLDDENDPSVKEKESEKDVD